MGNTIVEERKKSEEEEKILAENDLDLLPQFEESTSVTSSVPSAPAPTAATSGVNYPSAPTIAKEEFKSKANDGGIRGDVIEEQYEVQSESKVQETIYEDVSYEINKDDVTNLDQVSDDKEINHLAIFDWMIGEWKENTPNGISIEKWEKVDSKTIKGKGSLIANGVTIFSEKMEIRKTNKGIYMLIPLDNSNKKTKYKMVSNTGNMIVFENNKVEFPTQLVIHQKSNNDFTTSLQNQVEDTPESSPAQFLQNRNQVVNQKITRNLQRVK